MNKKSAFRFLEKTYGRERAHQMFRVAERPAKKRISIMLDQDVIAHFKSVGERQDVGYQTLINTILRRELKGKSA